MNYQYHIEHNTKLFNEKYTQLEYNIQNRCQTNTEILDRLLEHSELIQCIDAELRPDLIQKAKILLVKIQLIINTKL